MNRLLLKYLESDRQQMKAYIARRIPEEGITVVLATGKGGDLTADLDPIRYDDGEWDLHWETNDRDAIDLDDIYEHFRRQEMTWEEWRRGRQAEMDRWRFPALEKEVASLRWVRADVVMAVKTAVDFVAGSDVAVQEQMRYENNLGIFRLTGDYWVARFMKEEGHFPNQEGFKQIAKLLAAPEKLIEAIELQEAHTSLIATHAMKPQFDLDAAARQDLEKKLADLEQEIAQARDPSQILELQEEYETLNKHLKEGRNRRLGPSSPKEKARKAVRNNIDRAIEKVGNSMPDLATFLDRSVMCNGTAFIYTPSPPAPKWIL